MATKQQITVVLDQGAAESLEKLALACSAAHQAWKGFTRHGPLTLTSVLRMLAEDAAMVISRPGSWDGSNMAEVFCSHGYAL
jgi:hypothetical protein